MKGLRIGWLADWGGAYPMEDGILAACEGGLQVLEGLGAVVETAGAALSGREAVVILGDAARDADAGGKRRWPRTRASGRRPSPRRSGRSSRAQGFRPRRCMRRA